MFYTDIRMLLFSLTILLVIGNVEINPGPPKASNDDIFKLLTQNAEKLKQLDQLTSIQKNLTDLNASVSNLKSDIGGLTKDLCDTKGDISVIQKQNVELQKTVRNLDSRLRRNNVVLYGIDNKANETQSELETSVCQLLNSKLDVNISSEDIDTCYRLGKKFDKPRPILIKFCNYKTKNSLFKNISNLKGTQYAISDDLTPYERQQRTKLIKVKSRAVNMKLRCRITKNQLVIEGVAYSVEELDNPDLLDNIKRSIDEANLFETEDNLHNESDNVRKRGRDSDTPPPHITKKTNTDVDNMSEN